MVLPLNVCMQRLKSRTFTAVKHGRNIYVLEGKQVDKHIKRHGVKLLIVITDMCGSTMTILTNKIDLTDLPKPTKKNQPRSMVQEILERNVLFFFVLFSAASGSNKKPRTKINVFNSIQVQYRDMKLSEFIKSIKNKSPVYHSADAFSLSGTEPSATSVNAWGLV